MTGCVLKRLLGVAVLLASSVGTTVGAAELRQAVLVQNSGWMEPFYVDAESPFKPLVAQLAKAAAGQGEVVVGAFNQSDTTHPSPEWVYRGPGNHPGLAQAMTRLQMARKGSGALADTDFKEALLGAIEVGLEGRPGIIWIVTNNKNSPNNSTEVVARNREFYELLHGEYVISRIVAFPLKMPVQGQHYRANGLMLYALAYGEPASAALDAVLAQPALTTLLPEGHVRLKPLTEAAVRFSPTGVTDSPGIAAGLAGDGHTLVLSFDASTQVRTAQVQGRFENLFNPYRIVSADTSLVTPPAIGLQGEMSTRSLQALDPGKQSDPLTLRLSLPPLPSQWSREVLLRSGYERRGAIDIHLDNQQLEVSPQFRAHMADLFPGDALPEVFLPPVTANASVTRVPLLLRVQYPVWPAVVVYGGGLLALIAALLFLVLVTGARKATVWIDDQPQHLRLRPFTTTEVRDANGTHVATVRRGAFKPRVSWAQPDTSIRIN